MKKFDGLDPVHSQLAIQIIYANPDFLRHHREGLKAVFADPNACRRINESTLKIWQEPAYRRHMDGVFADPAFRQELSNAIGRRR